MMYYVDEVIKVLITELKNSILKVLDWFCLIPLSFVFLFFGIKWIDVLLHSSLIFPPSQIKKLYVQSVNEIFSSSEEKLLKINPTFRRAKEFEEKIISSNEFYETNNLAWNVVAIAVNSTQIFFVQTIERQVDGYGQALEKEKKNSDSDSHSPPPFNIYLVGLFCLIFVGLLARDFRTSRIKSSVVIDLPGIHPHVQLMVHFGVVSALIIAMDFDTSGGFYVITLFFSVVQLLSWNPLIFPFFHRNRARLLYSVVNCKIYFTALQYLVWLLLEQGKIRNHTKLLCHLAEALVAFDLDGYVVEGFFSSIKMKRLYVQYSKENLRNLYEGHQARRIQAMSLFGFFALFFYLCLYDFSNNDFRRARHEGLSEFRKKLVDLKEDLQSH